MEKLIILSDLWGKFHSSWIYNYVNLLNKKYEIIFYDCKELANIDKNNLDEIAIHNQFLNYGIENVVNKLCEIETEPLDVLGFSIGGYIGWKAVNKGLKVNNLFAVSSTRIRLENKKPNCDIKLFYGENDSYKPSLEWFNMHKINYKIFNNESHDFYKKEVIYREICDKILK